jgi:hypothetical protein
MTMTCGLCLHDAHPANQCGEVHVIRAPHSTCVVERIQCPCWHDQAESRIRELLTEVYLPEGVDIWLAATHKAGSLHGRCPNEMLAAGDVEPVLAAAEQLTGGAW